MLSEEELNSPRGKIAAIERWLGQNGDRRQVLDQIKDSVFDNLKPSQIEPAYYDYLEAVRDLIEAM